jgi:hypothetical protein
MAIDAAMAEAAACLVKLNIPISSLSAPAGRRVPILA